MKTEAHKSAELIYQKFYFGIFNNGYINSGFWSINNVSYFAYILAINYCKCKLEKCVSKDQKHHWKSIILILKENERESKSETNY